MTQLKSKLEEFDRSYGVIAKWVWRIVFYPIVALAIYATTAYLDKHYVSRQYFDNELAKLADDKSKAAEEQKSTLKEISGKLDALLLRDSANAQRFSDYDRRLEKVEGKVDRLQDRAR